MNVVPHIAGLMVNLTTISNFAALFQNYKAVDRATDLMKNPTLKMVTTFGILLLQHHSVGLAVEYSSSAISVLNFDFYFCWFDKLMSKKSVIRNMNQGRTWGGDCVRVRPV